MTSLSCESSRSALWARKVSLPRTICIDLSWLHCSSTRNFVLTVGTDGDGLADRELGTLILASVKYTSRRTFLNPFSSNIAPSRPMCWSRGIVIEETADPVQMAAYNSVSFVKVSVSQQRIMAGHGPSTNSPGGGWPEALGELCIDPRSRLFSKPKLFALPKPTVLLRPSDLCE